ncbi:MAG: hypothetical protein KTV77_03960 [Wolbachia endosymbiont of Fragariocoptes setiger]|nr:hypothetical protein [Wolbachia endosymbiont of Fragariocoptes setiger]
MIYDDLLSPNSTLRILDKLLNNENNISARDICLNLLKESEQQASNNYIDYNHIFASNPEYKNTSLHIAVYNNDLEQAKHLIKEGSDIYVRNKANHSPSALLLVLAK